MRGIVWLLVAAMAACSDPGPRDRSLLQVGETIPLHPDVFPARRAARRSKRLPIATQVGLQTDSLAPLYPMDARLVVRCADLATLEHHAAGRLQQIATILPDWRLPELPPMTLLRVRCGLPDGVLPDRLHPFAFVETAAGWVTLLPIKDAFPNSERLRRIDSRYCVAGSAEAVRAYAPGQQVGYCIDGDISVIAHGDALADLGQRLTRAAAALRIALPGLANLPHGSFEGMERADLALRWNGSGLQAEIRVVPDRARAADLAARIAALAPRAGRALGWLPADGTVTIATGCDLASLLGLGARFGLPAFHSDNEEHAAILKEAITTLGTDVAVCLRGDASDPIGLVAVAELSEPTVASARTLLGSQNMADLLRALGGEKNGLVYRPADYERQGVAVATIDGRAVAGSLYLPHADLLLGESVARLFARERCMHIVLHGNRLCVTMGEKGREAMIALLDRISDDPAASAVPRAHSNRLEQKPLVEATLDAAVLLRRAWPGALADPQERLLVEVAIAAEGDALHLTARLPLARIASAWAAPTVTPARVAPAAPPERD